MGRGLGVDKAHVQQETIHQWQGQPAPHHRSKVLDDLAEKIPTTMSNGEDVILTNDANESLESQGGLTRFLTDTVLVDPILQTNGFEINQTPGRTCTDITK